MLGKNKTIGLYITIFICVLSAILGIYSCNVDEYQYINESETADNKAMLFSKTRNSGNALVDSVANSYEFYIFEICSERLSDKFSAYTSKLSDEEYDKLMVNLNDDEYMEDFIKKANLEKELQQMDEANKNFLQHTVFLKLSEDEQTLLFKQYAESLKPTGQKLLKTRTEGGDTNTCEGKRQVAYAQAKVDYDKAIAKCRMESSTNFCYSQASAKYEREKDIANIDYEACILKK